MNGSSNPKSGTRPNRERADSAIGGIEDGEQAKLGKHGCNALDPLLKRLRTIPDDEITEYQRDVTDAIEATKRCLTNRSLEVSDDRAIINSLWAKLSQKPGSSRHRGDDPFIQAAEQNLLYAQDFNQMIDAEVADAVAEHWFDDMNDKVMMRDEERKNSGQFEDQKSPHDNGEVVESLRYSPEEKNFEANMKQWKEKYDGKVQTGQISGTDGWKIGLSQEMIDYRMEERAESIEKGYEVAIQNQIATDANLAKQKLEIGARDKVEDSRSKSSEELSGKMGNPKKERNLFRKLSSFTKK